MQRSAVAFEAAEIQRKPCFCMRYSSVLRVSPSSRAALVRLPSWRSSACCSKSRSSSSRRTPPGGRRNPVVNVGAVGLPFNRDRRAQYALVQVDQETVEVEFRQVEYDLDSTLRDYETSGFLQHGGATARLLRLELERAAPFLVPFIEWARARRVAPLPSEVDAFLDFYDPDESFRSFACRLRDLELEVEGVSRFR